MSCLAAHVPIPQVDHARLTWMDPRLGERCRVIAWTCHCRSVVYELCASGGQVFLRRTVQGTPRTVQETGRTRMAEGQELWAAMLTGRAR